MREKTLLLLVVGLAFFAALLPQPRTVDDAFITFRYSRNLVEGHGFVYNVGDRVLGTTTPLYTGIMAICGALFGEAYPWYALIVNAFAAAIGVALLFEITLRLSRNIWLAAWIGAAWAIAPEPVTFAVGGMETAVHNALMLGAWYSYLTDRPRWLGACCALGVLTRPDALIWALPLLAHQLWRTWWAERRLPLATWLTGIIIITPWLIFATLYFGSPLPHTVGTKAAVYNVPSIQAISLFLRQYAIPFKESVTFGVAAAFIGLVLYPTLALIGLRDSTRYEGRGLPILLYPWLYAAVFSIANPLIFRWYLTPPMPAYFISIACGVGALVVLLPNPRVGQAMMAAAATLTLLMTINAWELRPDHGPQTPAPRMAFHDLELNYARMARTLRAEYGVDENTRLAAGDIGALGFYSRAYILDTIGLVTEGTPEYYADRDYIESIRPTDEDANYAVPPAILLDWQPEFVVMMELYIRNGVLKDDQFAAQYELIEEIPTDYYGTGMLTFQRRSTP